METDDLNIVQWLKMKLDAETARCQRKIECCLIRTFSESKKEEMKHICLSEDFDKRLLNKLALVEQENPGTIQTVLQGLLYNKKLNYAMATGLTVLLAGIILYNTENKTGLTEKSGVVMKNTHYLDKPSAQVFSEGDNTPGTINIEQNRETILELEKYYRSIGKNSVANELQMLIER